MKINWHSFNILMGGATALLVGCDGGYRASTPVGVVQNAAPRGSQTFKYTGAAQHFTVPSGVTELTVTARGAGTPSGHFPSSGPYYTGSNGGLVQATIPVTPGERLAIFVGGHGALGISGAGGAGGFNGGGAGGDGVHGSSGYLVDGGVGGGGASDIREGGDKLKDRVVVAGGGGGPGIGAGYLFSTGFGGQGGGKIGGPGGSSYPGNPSGFGGSGGTQTAGGAGGAGGNRSGFPPGVPGNPGKIGRGGGGGSNPSSGGGGGGAGGGGYYGAGGGGSGTLATSGIGSGGGGGGGSSYIEKSATHVKNLQGGGTAGNGKIVLTW
jgi:hypothetical protein